MTFPFSSLALVVDPGPEFVLGTLPGKLAQRIPQGFTTGITMVGLGVGSALKDD